MKTVKVMFVLVLAVTLLAAVGCKKEPAKTVPTPTTETAAPAAPKTETSTATTTTTSTTSTTTSIAKTEAPAVAAPAMGFDASKSLDTVKAEAAKMDIKQLTAMAQVCKEAYTTKQLDLAKITEQLKAIPMTEKLGAESQKLAGEAKTAQEALGNIGAQLSVYLDKLKGMGADTSSLQVK